jgi:hypothetical protein
LTSANFSKHKSRVTAPIACCPVAIKNRLACAGLRRCFALFGEKIGNNYIVMKKSLKISFSLFKVFTEEVGE